MLGFFDGEEGMKFSQKNSQHALLTFKYFQNIHRQISEMKSFKLMNLPKINILCTTDNFHIPN